mgnify:CR=1 FL=1
MKQIIINFINQFIFTKESIPKESENFAVAVFVIALVVFTIGILSIN